MTEQGASCSTSGVGAGRELFDGVTPPPWNTYIAAADEDHAEVETVEKPPPSQKPLRLQCARAPGHAGGSSTPPADSTSARCGHAMGCSDIAIDIEERGRVISVTSARAGAVCSFSAIYSQSLLIPSDS